MTKGDVEAARERERRLWEAFRANDRARLEALIDPLALDVGPAGALDRDHVVAAVGRMSIDTYTIDDVRVRSHETFDVVTYRAAVDGTYDGAPFASREIFATSVWARFGDEWRLVHRHECPTRRRNDRESPA